MRAFEAFSKFTRVLLSDLEGLTATDAQLGSFTHSFKLSCLNDLVERDPQLHTSFHPCHASSLLAAKLASVGQACPCPKSTPARLMR